MGRYIDILTIIINFPYSIQCSENNGIYSIIIHTYYIYNTIQYKTTIQLKKRRNLSNKCIHVYAIVYYTIQYNTIQYTIQFNTIQYNTIHFIIQYNIIQYIKKIKIQQ